EELSLMRTTLAASMLNAISRNQKKGNLSGRLYEIGKKFIAKDLPLTDYPDERETLCIGIFGEKESFFTLKGMAEKVAESLYVKFDYIPDKKSFLHPYQTAKIVCSGEEVGYLGKVAYPVADKLDLRTDAYLLEIDLKTLYALPAGKASFEPLPKFPGESRDLALVMDKAVTCGQVEDCIREACAYAKNVKLFDKYEGAPIPPTKKSMAFTIDFVPGAEPFEAESVDHFVKKILKNLKNKLDIDLRS
ncbi:MAG: phenylalanine--tRNA ligase subunit beta, partial [Lachnospiraceae bacterium]|nr:phenylalanine--tRNA ligase subunit beta [Lachnospiraceae bacterium]